MRIVLQLSLIHILVNKAEEPKTLKATISGKVCESGDIVVKEVKIAKPEPGIERHLAGCTTALSDLCGERFRKFRC